MDLIKYARFSIYEEYILPSYFTRNNQTLCIMSTLITAIFTLFLAFIDFLKGIQNVKNIYLSPKPKNQ